MKVQFIEGMKHENQQCFLCKRVKVQELIGSLSKQTWSAHK